MEKIESSENNTFFCLKIDGKAVCGLYAEEETFVKKKEHIPEYSEKKVLYISNFRTIPLKRNRGYGRKLLQYILDEYKDKYDLIHINACPYRFKRGVGVIYEAPYNGLCIEALTKFYETFGFKTFKATKDGWNVMLLM